jgi:hypothetical protein
MDPKPVPGNGSDVRLYSDSSGKADITASPVSANSRHPHVQLAWPEPAAWRLLLSLGKRGPKHRQTALRLRFGRFILQNIPVFREHTVGHSDNIGGDPIFGPSSS